ncbi:unnamed protein product [Mucor hiemalis]
MSQSFIILGGNDKKLILENATHPCPRCKKADTVQLTRSETFLIVFNKKIELPNKMRVRYECQKCHWKNETLPDDDPSFQSIPDIIEEEFTHNHNRQYSIGCSSFESYATATSSNFKKNGTSVRTFSSITF